MDMVEVDGLHIGYQRVGYGPPVVLVHGYVGDGPTTWRQQLEALADDFTLVAWDAPGAGTSADPPDGIGMSGYADCLAGFIDALGFDRPNVAGVSFGGALVLELCRRHPGIARTITLVSAYAGWRGSLPADVAEQRLRQSLALADLSPEALVETLLPTMFSATTPPAVVEEFLGDCLRAVRPSGFRAMAEASNVDLRAAATARRRPDVARLWRPGRARPTACRRGHARRDRRLDIGRAAGRRPRVQHGSSCRVQRRAAVVPRRARRMNATTRDWVWPPWWRVLIDLAVVILVVAVWIWWRRRRRTQFPSTTED